MPPSPGAVQPVAPQPGPTPVTGNIADPFALAPEAASAATPPTPEPEPRPVTRPVSGNGAGEAAAYSLQAYQALWRHLDAQVAERKRGGAVRSVVLAADATLDSPRYATCGQKPLAVIFDLDENADVGVNGTIDPDARWRRWNGDGSDQVIAVPGAVEGVEAARREGVTVIFTSDRRREGAAGVIALMARLGFGALESGRTLHLRGDLENPAADDPLRQSIAQNYCVIALVGDSLGEFSDLFEAQGGAARAPTAATETMVAPLWGAGWFLLPNPVRSTVKPAPAQPPAAAATPAPAGPTTDMPQGVK